MRHCERTSISEPCRSSVCNSKAVSRPSSEERPPLPYAYQLNVTIPPGLADGDAAVVATVRRSTTQTNLFITVQH